MSIYERNPWEESEASMGAISQAITLAQRTGHIKWNFNDGEKNRSMEPTYVKFSLHLTELLRKIEEGRKKLDQVLHEIQVRTQTVDTSDLTQLETLEERIADISKLNTHLQAIVSQKDQLVSRLQKPYIGDFLRIEAPYKSDVAAVVPSIAPILSSLPAQIAHMQAVHALDFPDKQLEGILTDITANLATLQSSFQDLFSLRNTIGELDSQRAVNPL